MWDKGEVRFPKGLIPMKVSEVPNLRECVYIDYVNPYSPSKFDVDKKTNYQGEACLLVPTLEEVYNNLNAVGTTKNGCGCPDEGPRCTGGSKTPVNLPHQTAPWYAEKQEWIGGSLKDLVEMAIYPPALAAIGQLQDIARTKIPESLSPRRVKRLSREEGELDIQRWVDQKETFLVDRRRGIRTGSGMFLDVYAAVEGHCGLKAEEIMWSGLPAVAFVDIAESAGYRCRVYFCNTSLNAIKGSQRLDLLCCVKDYNDILDPERMLFYLGSPGFFRGVILPAYRLAGADINYGHGRPPGRHEEVAVAVYQLLKATGREEDARHYVFGATHTKAAAIKILESQIENLLAHRDLFSKDVK